MQKFCGKCGQEMHPDDFLCPNCGAIWGDRIYRSPVTFTEGSPEKDKSAESAPPEDAPVAKSYKRYWLWMVPLLIIAVLAIGIAQRFTAGERVQVPTTTTPPTTTQPIPYPVVISNYLWLDALHEPLEDQYMGGQTVYVKVNIGEHTEFLLFVNDREVTERTLIDGNIWQYSFVMPHAPANIRLRIFPFSFAEPEALELIRQYYRLYPNADDNYLSAYYGKYGDAIVGRFRYTPNKMYYSKERVAGYIFTYNRNNPIQVLIDGQFISLQQAYEEGHLVAEDIIRIFRKHIGDPTTPTD